MSAAGSGGIPSRSDRRRSLDGKVPALTTVTAKPCIAIELDGRQAVADEGKPPGPLCRVESFHRPFPEQAALRIKGKRERIRSLDGLLRARGPDRLLSSQEFTVALPFGMHGDHKIVGLAKPGGHGGCEPGFHLDMDQRITGDEARDQRRDDQGPIIVHDAEPDNALNRALAQPADRLVVQRQDATRIAEQALAGGAQIYIRLGAVKQLRLKSIFQSLDLHAHGGLCPVEHRGRAREGTLVGHRNKCFQEIRIQDGRAHNEPLFLVSHEFDFLIRGCLLPCATRNNKDERMGEVWGVLAAVLSSGLGGTSIGATRYLAGAIDPLAIGSFRFGIGFLLLLPVTVLQRGNWPAWRDWPGIACLGLLFFALFPILFNASLIFTTAARGALALSTLPLLTMVVGAAFGTEPLTARKTIGVMVAIFGVAVALVTGLTAAPPGAWCGDLMMIAAAFCMALYNIWSKPFIRRSGPLPFTTVSMGIGALCLLLIAWLRGSFVPVAGFGAPQWLAAAYLGAFGSALTFFLWAFALERTTPTRVAISVTVNPITASLVGAALLGEPLGWHLASGIMTVFAGIWIATTDGASGMNARAERTSSEGV